MPLEASIHHVGTDLAIVQVTGALTLGTGLKTVDQKMQGLVEQGFSRMVLDLAGVPYADSAGLGSLLHTFGLLQERGGRLRLCGVSERVASLLRMTKTDTLLPQDADVDASVAALG